MRSLGNCNQLILHTSAAQASVCTAAGRRSRDAMAAQIGAQVTEFELALLVLNYLEGDAKCPKTAQSFRR